MHCEENNGLSSDSYGEKLLLLILCFLPWSDTALGPWHFASLDKKPGTAQNKGRAASLVGKMGVFKCKHSRNSVRANRLKCCPNNYNHARSVGIYCKWVVFCQVSQYACYFREKQKPYRRQHLETLAGWKIRAWSIFAADRCTMRGAKLSVQLACVAICPGPYQMGSDGMLTRPPFVDAPRTVPPAPLRCRSPFETQETWHGIRWRR